MNPVKDATIAELRRQNELLLAKVEALSAIVELIPRTILNARLDALSNRTTFIPDGHRKALNLPTF